MPQGHGPRGKHATLARERERLAFALRLRGKTHEAIAKELPPHPGQEGQPDRPVTRQAVSKILRRVLERTVDLTNEAAQQYRREQVAILDAMRESLWSKVEAGDVAAVDAVRKLEDRKSLLLGLDAPKRQSIESSNVQRVVYEIPDNASDGPSGTEPDAIASKPEGDA